MSAHVRKQVLLLVRALNPVPRGRASAAGLVAVALLGGAAAPAAAIPAVALNEILADPARDWNGDATVDAVDDEWIEIVNTGAVPVDLTGLRIGDLDRAWGYGFSGSLAVEGRLVVYGSDAKAWQQANGVGAFGLRLANAGDTVVLWQVTATDTTLVDRYTYADHEADDDRSSGRRPDGAPTWELFDALNPYSGGALPQGNGCAPTPAASNHCTTAVEDATWGEIKARHHPAGE
jgi:hypothetical protein